MNKMPKELKKKLKNKLKNKKGIVGVDEIKDFYIHIDKEQISEEEKKMIQIETNSNMLFYKL